MYQKNPGLKGVLVIVVASFLWGTTGTAASFTPNVSPLATGAFAMGLGGLLLVLTSMSSLNRDADKLASSYKLLLIGGMSVAVYPLAFYSSMRLSGIAIGTVVSLASAPLFTVLLEYVVDKKPVSKKWVISFVIGGVGITMLATGNLNEGEHGFQSSGHYWGMLVGLLAGLSYSLYSWAGKYLIGQGVSSKSAMSGMFGLAALVLLPSLVWTGDNLFSSTMNTSVALYMAVVPMFVGYVLFGYGLNYVQASRATLVTLLEPVVATIMAVLIVGERLSIIGWLGVVLIVICLLLQVIGQLMFSESIE